MNCPYCLSLATKEQSKRTSLGYRLCRCSDCKRAFNERTATPFNGSGISHRSCASRCAVAVTLQALVCGMWPRYFSSAVGCSPMRPDADWEARFAPLIAEQLRTRAPWTSWNVLVLDAHLHESPREMVFPLLGD